MDYLFYNNRVLIMQAKAAYDSVLAEISRDTAQLDIIITARDLSYRGFILDSVQAPANKDENSVPEVEVNHSATVIDAEEAPAVPTKLRGVRIRRDSLTEAQV